MFNFNFDFYEIIVWVAVAIMCSVAYFCKRFPLRKRGAIGQPLSNPICLILPIVFFVLMDGFRKNVGDTPYYVLSFEEYMPDHNEVTVNMFFTEMFTFFQSLIRNMTDDGMWLCMFSAVFTIPVVFIILYLYSYPFAPAIYMFVATGYFGGMMNGMRQYMAATIVLLGTRYLFSLKRSSFIKYAAIIMLAWSMHNSALILIPMFFVFRRKAWRISSYLIIIGSVFVTFAANDLLPSFLGAVEDTSYSIYANNGWFTNGSEGGSNIGRAAATAVPIVVAYFNRERMQRLGHIGDILINIAFVNTGIYIVSTYNWIFARLAIYLTVYYIIFSVWVVNFAVKPKDKMTYSILFYVLYFFFSRTQGYQIAMYMSDYFFPGRKLFRS